MILEAGWIELNFGGRSPKQRSKGLKRKGGLMVSNPANDFLRANKIRFTEGIKVIGKASLKERSSTLIEFQTHRLDSLVDQLLNIFQMQEKSMIRFEGKIMFLML